MRRCLTCALAGLLWLPAAIAYADPMSAKALLEGLRENREKLTSGIFRTSGVRETLKRKDRLGSTVRFCAYCAFDGSLRRFRYDETFTDRYAPLDAGKTRSEAVKYVRLPDRTIHAVMNGNPLAIEIGPPEAPVRGGEVTPFDPRVLGLVSELEFRNGMRGQGFARSFESVFESYANKHHVEEVAQEAESVHRITFRFGPSDEFRKTLWIDAARGFTPVRMEVRRPKGGQLQAEPVVVTTAKWKEIAGVWVPVQSQMESRFNDDRMNVELTWEKVNEPVPDEVFTIAGLDIPDTVPWKAPDDGTVYQVVPEIVDYRQTPPLVLRQHVFLEPEEVP